jgi:hypothetical protein
MVVVAGVVVDSGASSRRAGIGGVGGHAPCATKSNRGIDEYWETSPASTTFSTLPVVAHVLRTKNCTANDVPGCVLPHFDLTVTSCMGIPTATTKTRFYASIEAGVQSFQDSPTIQKSTKQNAGAPSCSPPAV